MEQNTSDTLQHPNLAPPQTSPQPESKLQGLGGWLILVGLNVVFAPIRIIVNLFPEYAKLFSEGLWLLMTAPESECYNPFWVPFVITEFACNCVLVAGWIYLASQFFRKRASFPKLFILMLIFTLVFQLLDSWVSTLVFPDTEAFDQETIKELTRTVLVAFIWIPYMLFSKRVKATFIS